MPRIRWRALLGAAIASTALAGAAQAADQLRFMTGPQGGSWVPLGGSMKAMWEKALPGTTVQVLPGAGIANVRGVNEGKADIGFGNSISTVDGLNGVEPFKEKATKVCNVANLYPQYFQVVARADSGISTAADLKGKTIVAQPRGNTAEVITQHFLKAHGMSYNDVKVNFVASYTDGVALVQDGNAHVMTMGTTIPASAVMDLASARDVTLVPIDDKGVAAIKTINSGYMKGVIPAGTYPKQDKDVPVIVYSTHLIARCDLPENVVYGMTKAMADNVADLVAITKAMAGLTPKVMAADIGVPLHPGAAKFYKEQGAL
jgi:hypothetical protein